VIVLKIISVQRLQPGFIIINFKSNENGGRL
jgi:hypothetical protein